MIDTKALKQKILDLAMRGKLVPQDPNDEPVEELLARIREERKKLEKEKKISKVEESDIYWSDDDNCYYEKNKKIDDLEKIPNHWKYIKLGFYSQKVTDYVASGSFASLNQNVKYFKDENYAILVKTQDFQSNFKNNLTYTDKHGYEFLSNSNLFGGELILSNIGSIGKVFIVPRLNKPMTLAPNSIMIRFFDENHIGFVRRFFESNIGFKALMSISSGTTMKKFNKTDLKEILIPIPPYQEQERIVNKIDELFELVDKIEKDQQELEELKKQAKDKVLELAVTGKLVKQDPNDEPASVLLERIKAEKEKLIKEGKIKREKADLEPISDDDKNYYKNLPLKWAICYMSEIISLTSGTDLTPEDYSSTNIGVPYLTGASNITDDNKILINRFTRTKYINSHKGNILLTCKGTIGKIVENEIGDVHVARQFMSIESFILNKYLIMCLRTMIDELNANAKSMIPGIDRKQVLDKIIPLPPVNEQEKIIQKYDKFCKIMNI